MKLTIRKKLFILVAIIVTTYGLAVGFILVNFKSRLTEDARQITIAHLKENAGNAGAIINGDFEIARTIASTLAGIVGYETGVREALTATILTSTVRQNKRYLSAWLSQELSAVDPNWTLPYGRKRYTYYQAGDPVFDTVNATGDVPGSLYFNLKQARTEALLEPYLLSSTSSVKDDRNDYLGTSVCIPLIRDGKFIGLAGMDITLEALNFIADIKPYPGSSTFLVSSEGTIVSHEQNDLIGKRVTTLISRDTASLLGNIKGGIAASWIASEEDALIAFTPLRIGRAENHWSIGTIVPMAAITSSINTILVRTVAISIAGLIILIISVYIISGGITKPINLVNERLKELAKGHIRGGHIIKAKTDDEIGEMIGSVNTLVTNINEKVLFAVDIGAGKFDSEFRPSGDDDTLGMALQTMRQNLRDFRQEDERRKWANEGLTQLNDVLRMNFSTQDEFYFNALKTLVYYLRANQGGLFVVEQDETNDEKYIALVAAYAFTRKKFMEKRIAWGDTLVGQCILEKQLVYMKQIPEDYVKITSGLGEATPRVLIIVPLKTDTEVVGAIEIAAFADFQKHELQFIEKAAEIIAASISSYRTTTRTRALLERSQSIEKQMRENRMFFN